MADQVPQSTFTNVTINDPPTEAGGGITIMAQLRFLQGDEPGNVTHTLELVAREDFTTVNRATYRVYPVICTELRADFDQMVWTFTQLNLADVLVNPKTHLWNLIVTHDLGTLYNDAHIKPGDQLLLVVSEIPKTGG